MERIEYRTIDRSKWPAGAWDNEPDKVQWPDEATGLPCLAVRNSLGNWCGYVGVPPSHPFHSLDYDHASSGEADVDVHGGLTFAGPCSPKAAESDGICHVPGEGGEHNIWWLGFDCAHLGDLVPGMFAYRTYHLSDANETYRTLAYVQRQCASLARQLAAHALG